MKHIAAYLLAVLGGNANPKAEDIKAILESVSAKADDAKIEQLLKELSGKNVFELIEEGKKKMGSIAVAAAAAAPAAAASSAPAAAAHEEKKKEEKKEEEEEEEADMGLSLFD
eukprot:m51a1_g696 putative 60S ribosomal protein P2 (113) ;mRNA; r:365830-366168